MQHTTEVKLQHPIEVDGVRCEALRLRRPLVRDLELMERESSELAKTIALVSHLAEIAPQTVRELDAADFQQLSETVAGFFDGGSRT